ncbi:hypothetical protein ACVIGB_006489 [Bradyrhizobium sp. USDA 4341]
MGRRFEVPRHADRRGQVMRNPFRKPSEADKRAEAARVTLKAARAELAAIDAGKAAVQNDSVAFAKWSAQRNAAAVEVERLTGLIETIETDADIARKSEADAAARRRIVEARKDADELADRVRKDGPRIAGELLTLLRDCANQSLAANALNADLPEGEPPIPAADILARDFGTLDREDLSSRTVELWVSETTGVPVGDQDAVQSSDGVVGQFHVPNAAFRWRCVKRSFVETEFHPRTLLDWPGDLFRLVRLPRFDDVGVLIDGSSMTIEAMAAMDVAAAIKPTKRPARPVQIEQRPVDPTWPPSPAAAPTEADRPA